MAEIGCNHEKISTTKENRLKVWHCNECQKEFIVKDDFLYWGDSTIFLEGIISRSDVQMFQRALDEIIPEKPLLHIHKVKKNSICSEKAIYLSRNVNYNIYDEQGVFLATIQVVSIDLASAEFKLIKGNLEVADKVCYTATVSEVQDIYGA